MMSFHVILTLFGILSHNVWPFLAIHIVVLLEEKKLISSLSPLFSKYY